MKGTTLSKTLHTPLDEALDSELIATGRVTGKGRSGAPELKVWVLVRQDTGMSLGKAIAQTGHAFVTSYALTHHFNPQVAFTWMNAGQPKLSKRVRNEAELIKCFEACREMGLVSVIVEDEARTEFKEKTLTAVCVGPCLFDDLPKIVKQLQLIKAEIDNFA